MAKKKEVSVTKEVKELAVLINKLEKWILKYDKSPLSTAEKKYVREKNKKKNVFFFDHFFFFPSFFCLDIGWIAMWCPTTPEDHRTFKVSKQINFFFMKRR